MSTLVIPPDPPSPKDDAMQLHRAFKAIISFLIPFCINYHNTPILIINKPRFIPFIGFRCDATTVINILAHRDATQRAYLQHEYTSMYSQDLLKRISSKLSGRFENALLLWMHCPAGRDALILKQTLTVNKNLDAATQVICSRTPTQLHYLRHIYFTKFGINLEHDIQTNTSRHHKKILLAYMSTPRREGPEVNKEMAENDAVVLYKAGEKRLGMDEKTFVRIISERSAAQLAAINQFYRSKYGHSLKKAIKKETSGSFGRALFTIVQCANNPAKYFAKVLHRAMKGLGTDDKKLTRVIVTRSEIDLHHIKAEYLKKYKKTLNDAVYSETSGHYRVFLLSLLNPNQ